MARLLPLLLLVAAQAAAFDLQGHRGARGLAPENTLPAFARALSIGVTTLELDVGVTRDGVVVVSHERRLNPDLSRDADGHWLEALGPVTAQALAAPFGCDAGELAPALFALEQRGIVMRGRYTDEPAVLRRAGGGRDS